MLYLVRDAQSRARAVHAEDRIQDAPSRTKTMKSAWVRRFQRAELRSAARSRNPARWKRGYPGASAVAFSRFIASQLFGATATDPLTYAGVASLLAAVALLACYLPARRAARTEPIIALKCE
jgi:hypothetical protein